MICDIQDRRVLWDVFLSDDGDFGAGDPEDKTKYRLNDAQRADIFFHRSKFAYDPFHEKDRDRQDQISDHNDTN